MKIKYEPADVVTNKKEATDWFLSHSSGAVVCVRADGERKLCASFPEAQAFYDKVVRS